VAGGHGLEAHDVLLDDLDYPDDDTRARFADMRTRAAQTLRILKSTELASYQELGQYERLLVASTLGIHEFAYRPSATDPTVDTVSHALTRWSNVRGLEVHVGFVRADLSTYGILVNTREPGFQGRMEVADDTGSALGDFGAACVERAEHATRRNE
jgi:hypothetical protein